MTAEIRDDSCLGFVLEKMQDKMLLVGGFTELDEMDMYTTSEHVNYFIPSGNGFLCVSVSNEFVMIPFAWYDMSYKARKEMIILGKELYKYYTIDQGKPIYYTGLKNFYGNHSEQIAENVWEFKPA